MNHWVTGWVDWNLALDMQGGPNWAENFVDAPIIVNKVRGRGLHSILIRLSIYLSISMAVRVEEPHSYHTGCLMPTKEADEFYKNPMFYAMGHFSKFVKEGATKLGLASEDPKKLDATAFRNPDGSTAVVILNR